MLDKNAITAASKTLHDHWRAGTKFAGLDTSLRPRDRTEAYAIQAAIEKYSSESLFGWKIAATSEAGQKHINVDGPMAGRILAETVIPDGGTASMAGNEMRVAEPEFAFRMRVDLPARPTPYTCSRFSMRSTRCIRRSRFRIRALRISSAPAPRRSLPTMPARICSCSGPPTSADWRALDLVEERPVITLRGQQFIGHGKNVLGDPRVALTWLANELRQLGVTLKAGRIVTTGTCHPPLPIQSGDFCAVDFGSLGKVSVGFE